MTDIIPYELSTAIIPEAGQYTGGVQCVFITLQLEAHDMLLEKISAWFDGRAEVQIGDHGTTDKQELGFINLEWIGFEIDPLFLAILRDEELIEDYTVYSRNEEN